MRCCRDLAERWDGKLGLPVRGGFYPKAQAKSINVIGGVAKQKGKGTACNYRDYQGDGPGGEYLSNYVGQKNHQQTS